MTVRNVLGALAACTDVEAFLSVPYILKMLVEHPEGLEMLRTMNLVSTGGAPLPEACEWVNPHGKGQILIRPRF